VRHEERFVQSHQPYAVDLESMTVGAPSTAHGSVWVRIDAVWFRRRRSGYSGPMVTVASAGELRELMDTPPANARSFLESFTDGRYGGDTVARWDGESLWTVPGVTEAERAAYFKLLVPMLIDHPAIPPGYSGWWTFRS
jgi:hypothetical protein